MLTGMWTRMAGGFGLMASGPICLAGSLTRAAPCDLVWSAGAWLAVAATALVYRDIAGHARRAPAAVAMALLGVVASAGTVEATLRLAGDRWLGAHPVLLAVLVCGAAAGLAGVAYAAGRSGLVPPAAGLIAAVAALVSTLTADPAAPYLLGAGPLGAVLLARAIRSCTLKGHPL